MNPRPLAIGTHEELPAVKATIPGPCIIARAVALKKNGERLDAILDNDSQVVCFFAQPDPPDSQEAFQRHNDRCQAVLAAVNGIAGQ